MEPPDPSRSHLRPLPHDACKKLRKSRRVAQCGVGLNSSCAVHCSSKTCTNTSTTQPASWGLIPDYKKFIPELPFGSACLIPKCLMGTALHPSPPLPCSPGAKTTSVRPVRPVVLHFRVTGGKRGDQSSAVEETTGVTELSTEWTGCHR